MIDSMKFILLTNGFEIDENTIKPLELGEVARNSLSILFIGIMISITIFLIEIER